MGTVTYQRPVVINPKWLRGILKGQFLRIWRTCTSAKDYALQSEMVAKKIKEKGYREDFLTSIQTQAFNLDTQDLLENKPKRSYDNRNNLAFLMDFSRDYKSLEHVI